MGSSISAKTKIYLVFFLSGISGLIYETVWLRIFTRTLGSTVYATSVVLGSFMAGLALGSYAFGIFGDRIKNKLRAYAVLELSIGILALILPFLFKGLLPLYRVIYSMAQGERFLLTVFQAVILFALLLVPTSLMGGTLPILASHTKQYKTAFSERLGYLYGLNTLGAVIGVLGSGFYSIGALGETSTLMIGCVINLAVALTAFILSKRPDEDAVLSEEALRSATIPYSQSISPYDDSTRKVVAIAYGVSGFVAMSYEIIWMRIFQIQIGTSMYAFSSMLAFYLVGIAIGSILEGRISHRIKNPLLVIGAFQFFIALYSIVGMHIFPVFKPFSIGYTRYFGLGNMLALPLVMVFPITLVLGMTFPMVSRCFVKDEMKTSRGVGFIYSINTIGCILGSFISGFILIELFGTRNSVLVLGAINIFLGILLLNRSTAPGRIRLSNPYIAGSVFVIFILGALSPDPFLSATKKIIKKVEARYKLKAKVYYHREDVLATATAFGIEPGTAHKYLLFNGIGMTKLCVETKLMAHIPLLLHPDPKDILVVCFGMGTTLRSAWMHRSVKCETVDLVSAAFDCFKYFHKDGPKILSDPRVGYYVDDGRNFLLMRPKLYDVITIDPAPPIWSAGTVNLYSKEFFNLCRLRLTPKGVMCLWVPPAELTEVMMIMKTFSVAFPNAHVFMGRKYRGIYLIGFRDPSMKVTSRGFVEADKDKAIVDDLNEWSEGEALMPQSLLALKILNPEELEEIVKDLPIVTDDLPYTEFPLWRSIFNKAYMWQSDAALSAIHKKLHGDNNL